MSVRHAQAPIGSRFLLLSKSAPPSTCVVALGDRNQRLAVDAELCTTRVPLLRASASPSAAVPFPCRALVSVTAPLELLA